MDIILLGVTVVSLGVALVMSVTAWRLMRDDKQRSSARVAALSVAASASESIAGFVREPETPKIVKAPWSAPRIAPALAVSAVAPVVELPLNQPSRIEPARVIEPPVRVSEPFVTHASGFLGAAEAQHDEGGRQKSLAFAAMFLFVVLAGGLMWMMSGPRGTTPVAVGPNSPLELVSLTHARQDKKLAVSGLVRNPASGKPIEHLSAVVFLFDRMGTFVTSSRANVDFLKLGAGDESPFVVSLDAPASVSRYRVSFRTDDGIVPHIDRRGASVAPAEGEQAVNVSAK
jgi:hypothetical protein